MNYVTRSKDPGELEFVSELRYTVTAHAAHITCSSVCERYSPIITHTRVDPVHRTHCPLISYHHLLDRASIPRGTTNNYNL